MPEADARGMVAYLEVLTNCLGGGEQKVSPVEARDRVAWLSQRCAEVQGPPGSFLDALMRLHANPVPSRLKAALLACAGAASGDGAAGAAETWARMGRGTLQTRAIRCPCRRHARARDAVPSHGRPVCGPRIRTRTERANRTRSDTTRGTAPPPPRATFFRERPRGERGARRRVRDQLLFPERTWRTSRALGGERVRAPQAHAYVRLVNRLACLRARGRPVRRRRARLARAIAFIRDRVFGELRRRRHRSQEERWWLARDALTHFRIQLRVWRDAVRSGDEAAFSQSERVGRDRDGASPRVETGYPYAPSTTGGPRSEPAPGAEIMADFMTDGPLFRGVCAVLAVGAERLAAERAAAHGAALEATAAEALALPPTRWRWTRRRSRDEEKSAGADADDAFGTGGDERGFATRERRARLRARRMVAMRAETVDRSLLRDPSVCACVLGFSRYRFDPNVPLRAIQILAVLSERNERLLDLLPASAVEALAEGAAGALELASSASKAPGSAPVYAEKNGNSAPHDETEEDAVAAAGAAVLDVILDALPRRAPNVAHALLGFDPALDPSRAVLAPFGEKFTCLTVLLELLEASPPGLCAGDLGAEPPEAAARVLFELVADERTAPAALEAVTNWPPGAGRAAAPRASRRRRSGGASARGPSPPRRRRAPPRVAPARPPPPRWTTARRWLRLSARLPFETLDDLPPLAAALARAAARSGMLTRRRRSRNTPTAISAAPPSKSRGSPRWRRWRPSPRRPSRRSPPPPGSWTRSSRRSARPPKARPPRRRARRARRWAQRRFCRTAARRRRAGASR